MKLLFFTCLLCMHCAANLYSQERPNILFLFSDDQRMDAVSAYGNVYIQTPNIDKLAHQGVKFTNAFCMGSHIGAVCEPSRAMLLSGKSLYNVYTELEGIETLPKTLRENGYITFGTGKWHNGRKPFREGFTHGRNIFFGGMSDHYNVPVVDMQEDGSFTEERLKGYSTDVFVDATLSFLQNYTTRKGEQPFFAYVAFTTPHDPRSPASEYTDHYKPEQMPLPPNYMPAHPFDLGIMRIRDENLGAWPRSPLQVKKQLADYYGMITHMDKRIGDILNALEQYGLMENTIIVFSSDHGLAIGSHGLLGKQNLYEASMKAPLIIKGPGIPANETRDALIYLFDIYPTLCNLVELPVPHRVDGIDLSAVIKGAKRDVRDALFTTYSDQQRAVKNHRWKLIRYPALHYSQLFDLKNDPYELNNLAGSEAHKEVLDTMHQTLQRWQTKMGDQLPLTTEKKREMEYDLSGHTRNPDRHQPEYTIKKYFKGEK